MRNLSTKHSDTHTSYVTIIQPGNLKLESQKFVKFIGKIYEWKRWKYRIECAFYGSVYNRVLTDEKDAGRNKNMN